MFPKPSQRSGKDHAMARALKPSDFAPLPRTMRLLRKSETSHGIAEYRLSLAVPVELDTTELRHAALLALLAAIRCERPFIAARLDEKYFRSVASAGDIEYVDSLRQVAISSLSEAVPYRYVGCEDVSPFLPGTEHECLVLLSRPDPPSLPLPLHAITDLNAVSVRVLGGCVAIRTRDAGLRCWLDVFQETESEESRQEKLIEELWSSKPNAARRAAYLLGVRGEMDSLPALYQWLSSGHSDPDVAARALVKIGDPEAAPHLRPLLHNPNWWVRRLGLLAIRALADSVAPELLADIESVQNDEDPRVRETAAIVIRSYRGEADRSSAPGEDGGVSAQLRPPTS